MPYELSRVETSAAINISYNYSTSPALGTAGRQVQGAHTEAAATEITEASSTQVVEDSVERSPFTACPKVREDFDEDYDITPPKSLVVSLKLADPFQRTGTTTHRLGRNSGEKSDASIVLSKESHTEGMALPRKTVSKLPHTEARDRGALARLRERRGEVVGEKRKALEQEEVEESQPPTKTPRSGGTQGDAVIISDHDESSPMPEDMNPNAISPAPEAPGQPHATLPKTPAVIQSNSPVTKDFVEGGDAVMFNTRLPSSRKANIVVFGKKGPRNQGILAVRTPGIKPGRLSMPPSKGFAAGPGRVTPGTRYGRPSFNGRKAPSSVATTQRTGKSARRAKSSNVANSVSQALNELYPKSNTPAILPEPAPAQHYDDFPNIDEFDDEIVDPPLKFKPTVSRKHTALERHKPEEQRIISSNVKPVPASPRAESTTITCHNITASKSKKLLKRINPTDLLEDPFTTPREFIAAKVYPTAGDSSESEPATHAEEQEGQNTPVASSDDDFLDQDVHGRRDIRASSADEEEMMGTTLIEHDESVSHKLKRLGLDAESPLASHVKRDVSDDLTAWTASLKPHQLSFFDQMVGFAQQLSTTIFENENVIEQAMDESHRRTQFMIEQEEKQRTKNYREMKKLFKRKTKDKLAEAEGYYNDLVRQAKEYEQEKKQMEKQRAVWEAENEELEAFINEHSL